MTHLGSPHETYDYIEQIGDGSFGTVHKAKNKISQKLVAVKVMKKKYSCIEECAGQFEPKLLNLLPVHMNIVQIYDCFLSPVTSELAFVMEYMDGGNLYQLMRERKLYNLPFNHCELRNILYQILSAVSHIHRHKVFHRDMKPENLLLDYSTGKPIIKLADFGLARELNSQPPFTEYVSTRWYRAPEVLLRSTEYSFPVDLWAIGAIFAELITLEPIFPGESEIDQIYRICDILGSPGNKSGVSIGQIKKVSVASSRPEKRTSPGFARKKAVMAAPAEKESASTISILDGGGEWKEGVKLAYKIGFKFPNLSPKPLESVIPNATESMINLIRHFLFFNPSQRWTADKALQHAFFTTEAIAEEPPVHTPMSRRSSNSKNNEPITPPCKPPITPLDLLSIPKSPYQICPDWKNYDSRPISSRYGRMNKEEEIVETPTGDGNAWIPPSRPIYSSHQKVHPVTDRPNSSHLWNKYNYASHQRPNTPVVVEHVGHHNHKEHPTATASTKRYSTLPEELDTHRRLGHHLLHHHPHENSSGRTPTNTTSFSLDRISHYGNQLIKWAPPHFGTASHHEPPTPKHHYHYHQPEPAEESRPHSRQSRSPLPFSSQLMNKKYSTTSHTGTTNTASSSPIQCWTSTTNTDKVDHHDWTRKPDKLQYRNSMSHRFNLWVPENDDEEEEEEAEHRSVYSPLPLQ